MLIDAFNKLQQVNVTAIDRGASERNKSPHLLSLGLDFQTGQTFTEMVQTVQINRRSSGEGSLHYSGSDEYGSCSPGPLKTTLHHVCKLCALSGIPQSHQKALGKVSRSCKSTAPFTLQLGSSHPPRSNEPGHQPRTPGSPVPRRPATGPFLPCRHLLAQLPSLTLSPSAAGIGSSRLVSHA